jgi:heme A synthase
MDVREYDPITPFQIGLHMAHRLTALVIVLAVGFCAWGARGGRAEQPGLFRLAVCWAALIAAQVVLGAATVWTNKAADVATAHVVLGAVSLTWGGILCALAFGQVLERRTSAAGAPLAAAEPCEGSLSGAFRSTVS